MFKHCPECKGEFQPWVTLCPDCGVALQTAPDQPSPKAQRELPPAHELVCMERGDPRALLEVAERLQAEGLSCRIDVHPPETPIRPLARQGSGAIAKGFGLYVRAADLEAARRIQTEHLRRSLPEAAGEALATGSELVDCPACGAALAEGAASCASCGLEFPEQGVDG